MFKSAVINVSKEMMAFSDFPPPRHYATYAPHRQVLEYFKLYAENFGLHEFIRFNTSVEKVEQADDYEETGRWTVIFRKETTNDVKTEIFDGVMVCTGHHTFPHMPIFYGKSQFRGRIMHSHSYRDSTEFADKTVLVVGLGNSGADIAVDLCKHAKQVYLSSRRGAWVISRKFLCGIPADAFANTRLLFSLPKSFLKWAFQFFANLHFNHGLFGLKPEHRGLETHPTISDDLPVRMLSAQVILKPNVQHFTETGVILDNNECIEVDYVIFATGYDFKFPFIDDRVISVDKNKVFLYKYMFPPHLPYPTLAIIGLVQVIGAVMPVSEMQCRWFTRLLKGKNTLPLRELMEEDIEQKRKGSRYIKTQRHTIQSFYIEYMDELAQEIGAKPNLFRMLFKDPVLAFHCLCSPCIPAQYRLVGPCKWDGAKECIKTAWQRSLSPLSETSFPWNRNGTKKGSTDDKKGSTNDDKKGLTDDKSTTTILLVTVLVFIVVYMYFFT